MSKTYLQIVKQIEALKREAETLRLKEQGGVVARIKEAIEHYGLTAADLGLGGKPGRKAGAMLAASPVKRRGPNKAKGKAKPLGVARFRDEAGNVWVGRGPRPHWLREALANGKTLADFAV